MNDHSLRVAWLGALAIGLAVPAVAESSRANHPKRHVVHHLKTRKPVTSQDQPINRRFASLDAYLANLEHLQAPVGGAWYKEVSPGRFELQKGGHLHLDTPDTAQTVFTRGELERKFGFAK
jgi:hypothetical protein